MGVPLVTQPGFLKPGSNHITVEVYRWSDGSYLEEQDFLAAERHFPRCVFLVRRLCLGLDGPGTAPGRPGLPAGPVGQDEFFRSTKGTWCLQTGSTSPCCKKPSRCAGSASPMGNPAPPDDWSSRPSRPVKARTIHLHKLKKLFRILFALLQKCCLFIHNRERQVRSFLRFNLP